MAVPQVLRVTGLAYFFDGVYWDGAEIQQKRKLFVDRIGWGGNECGSDIRLSKKRVVDETVGTIRFDRGEKGCCLPGKWRNHLGCVCHSVKYIFRWP